MIFTSKLAILLHLIDETGSVREASERMQLSYSTIWGLLNQAGKASDHPLVLRKRSGSDGSGCELSEKGRQMMESYDQYCAVLKKKADDLYREMFQGILE